MKWTMDSRWTLRPPWPNRKQKIVSDLKVMLCNLVIEKFLHIKFLHFGYCFSHCESQCESQKLNVRGNIKIRAI